MDGGLCRALPFFSLRLYFRAPRLHAGTLDVQRVLFNLHRKLLPTAVLKQRAQEYVNSNLLTQDLAERVVRVIESERAGDSTYINDVQGAVAEPVVAGAESNLTTRLSDEQMRTLLEQRVAMMQRGRYARMPGRTRASRISFACTTSLSMRSRVGSS